MPKEAVNPRSDGSEKAEVCYFRAFSQASACAGVMMRTGAQRLRG
jgi:hypothetical protein